MQQQAAQQQRVAEGMRPHSPVMEDPAYELEREIQSMGGVRY